MNAKEAKQLSEIRRKELEADKKALRLKPILEAIDQGDYICESILTGVSKYQAENIAQFYINLGYEVDINSYKVNRKSTKDPLTEYQLVISWDRV